MANSITRTYDIRVFRQQFDDNGAVSAVTLAPELCFQVDASCENIARAVCTLRLADMAEVDTSIADYNELAAIMSDVARGLIIECSVINPAL
jgi:hypothetical protein